MCLPLAEGTAFSHLKHLVLHVLALHVFQIDYHVEGGPRLIFKVPEGGTAFNFQGPGGGDRVHLSPPDGTFTFTTI